MSKARTVSLFCVVSVALALGLACSQPGAETAVAASGRAPGEGQAEAEAESKPERPPRPAGQPLPDRALPETPVPRAVPESSTTPSYPVPLAATGVDICYDGRGDEVDCGGTGFDGQAPAGVPLPRPRFRVNGDGTLTDRLTGLVWLTNANCFGPLIWSDLVAAVAALGDGSECTSPPHLADGSRPGDWRVPNRNELNSLLSLVFEEPALSNAAGDGPWQEGDPFFHVELRSSYMTSTPAPSRPGKVWGIKMRDGNMGRRQIAEPHVVIPVRGPVTDGEG